MATLKIVDFGARPGSGEDCSDAFRQVLGASSPGDVIFFDSGVYVFDLPMIDMSDH